MPHTKQRYLFIDLLRFIAVFFMIQGHTFDAVLDLTIKSHTMFYYHDLFHGLVAPMFLFSSGVAFSVATIKKWEKHITFGTTVLRRFGKFFTLLVIGYGLHLPYFSFSKIMAEATDAQMLSWMQVDALHCIAVSLIVLQLLVYIVKREELFLTVIVVATAGLLFSSPFFWSIDTSGLPMWFAPYINSNTGSWFPLFPWTAYILFGVIFGIYFVNAKEQGTAAQFMERIVVIGVALVLAALVISNIPLNIYPIHDFWKVNPSVILARVGFVGILASSIYFLENSYNLRYRLPKVMGQESLFIYVLHLLILYGSVVNPGFSKIYGKSLNVWESGGIFIITFVIVAFSTLLWHEGKVRFPRYMLYGQVAGGTFMLYLFFTRPW